MIHVAKTPTSKPEIPASPVLEEDDEPVDADELTPEDANKPVGELAKGTDADGVETVAMPKKDLPDDENLPPKKKDFKPKKDKKLAVPDFNKFRLYLLIGGSLLFILIVGFLSGLFLFNRATINIRNQCFKNQCR
jgi:hypothetical protein